MGLFSIGRLTQAGLINGANRRNHKKLLKQQRRQTAVLERMAAHQPVTQGPPPGWYQDPDGTGAQRWWNGTTWTEHRQAQQ
jgi:hypothetical protein